VCNVHCAIRARHQKRRKRDGGTDLVEHIVAGLSYAGGMGEFKIG
jgi:hypothetical protein